MDAYLICSLMAASLESAYLWRAREALDVIGMARSAFFTSSNGWNTTPVIGILFVSTVEDAATTPLPLVCLEKLRDITDGEAEEETPWGSSDTAGLAVKEESALDAIRERERKVFFSIGRGKVFRFIAAAVDCLLMMMMIREEEKWGLNKRDMACGHRWIIIHVEGVDKTRCRGVWRPRASSNGIV